MELIVECNDLKNGGIFPLKYTHRGGDNSPEFILKNISEKEKTIAIIFDDMDKPMNHWIIWNLPAIGIIPGNISKEEVLINFKNVRQKRQYKGPNPPKGIRHKYQFNIFVLDCEFILVNEVDKKKLVKAMDGHIVQNGFIYGYYE